MKANRKWMFNADRAEVGIGTLIVFIAMVLVAAVAAAVLIATGGNLQQRAQSTGEGAVQQSSEAFKLVSIDGVTNAAKTKIDIVNIQISLAAGARPLGMDEMMVQYATGTVAATNLEWSSSAASASYYKTEIVRLIKNTDTASNLLYPGEIVKITIGTSASGAWPLDLDPRSDIRLNVIPEFGSPLPIEFSTPGIYQNTYVQIR